MLSNNAIQALTANQTLYHFTGMVEAVREHIEKGFKIIWERMGIMACANPEHGNFLFMTFNNLQGTTPTLSWSVCYMGRHRVPSMEITITKADGSQESVIYEQHVPSWGMRNHAKDAQGALLRAAQLNGEFAHHAFLAHVYRLLVEHQNDVKDAEAKNRAV